MIILKDDNRWNNTNQPLQWAPCPLPWKRVEEKLGCFEYSYGICKLRVECSTLLKIYHLVGLQFQKWSIVGGGPEYSAGISRRCPWWNLRAGRDIGNETDPRLGSLAKFTRAIFASHGKSSKFRMEKQPTGSPYFPENLCETNVEPVR